jgi:sigma-B regulation protein RsbU (phosphoserine phosphatase)
VEAQSKRLLVGSIAVELGLLTPEQLAEALKEQEAKGEPIGKILVHRGLIKPDALGKLLAEQGRRVRALSEELGARQKHLDAELRVAREIQRALVPMTLPAIPGVDLAAYFAAADAIGGDFYDVALLADGSWYLSIGDVAGRGIPAALVMSMALGLVRVAALSRGSPSDILAQVNSLLKGRMGRGVFLTMLYFAADPKKKVARFCSAGHPPPVVVRRDGRAELLRAKGAAVGILSPARFYKSLSEVAVDLADVRSMVFYTDGLIEAMSLKKEKYGDARLLATAGRGSSGSSADLLKTLLDDVSSHTGGRLPSDDLAILCAKFD